jgi:hypothetical protein
MPFLSWGMCKWHVGFSFVVLLVGYIFCPFPPFSDFQRQLAFFYLIFICIFRRFLKLGSLEYLEAPLIGRQTFLPIFKGGIGFVFAKVITLATYLRS